MSSMMKKKTGPGFKPTARPRRPGPTPSQPSKSPDVPTVANDASPGIGATSRETSSADVAAPTTELTSVGTSATPDVQPRADSIARRTPADSVRGERTDTSTPDEGSGENGEAGQDGEVPEGDRSQPPKKRRQTRPKTGEGEAGETTQSQRKPRKRSQLSTEGEEGGGEGATRTRKRRDRSATPEDAETQRVDGSKLTLQDLTKDLRIGKKFSRHDELLQRERERLLNKRQKKTPGETSEAASRTSTPAPPPPAPAPAPPPSSSSQGPAPVPEPEPQAELEPLGPRFIQVDGQIVLDQSSLTLDRHAREQQRALAAGESLVEEEEHEFSRLTTSNSFRTGSKLRGPNLWNEEDTELFYRGLGMFGTDFQLIANMFPGRSRRHVKMKFNREERVNPGRIHLALVGQKTVKIDIEQYKSWTGAEYRPVEEIMAEHKARQAEHDALARRQVEERAEEMRRKREALFADGPAQGEPGDEAGRKKKRTKKKDKMNDPSMYGEVVEETMVGDV
ncbi:hypothetical protein SODALDRAFT_352851 [Sodiomyces alkalinus F11]|uniref:Myb-like domain-containing protein n=1 Tax=Sodiomyces alkalinus (strain CBS 110278 / VKM F-3762 / F11) TaxID=1314773 RepID=A0A3N2PN94_SODAK|nr:hypothetical protein SODALDRAFT_352851 [Sodiomyces alkalinus F11]ROT36007.1 hypothetical protein SODALDRAFT_352851 [Sodiomyces alkalinus F11]